MTENWWNNYIGIPYAARGRARDGLDCWGLVRLVYADQFDLCLPNLADQYDADDRSREAELIAIGKEGWEKTEQPRSGDVVLCRIEGQETHVGLLTQPGFFLHVRQGQDSVVERMDSGAWKHRIVGVYRYREHGSAITLSGCPHPLKTLKIEREVGQGQTLAQIAATVRGDANIQVSEDAVIAVDGQYIPKSEWERYYPKPGSRIEYRATVTGSGVGRMLAMVAIMVVAWYAAPLLVGGAWGGMAALSGGQLLAANVVAMGINMVGGLLLNAIFPVRPPSQPSMSAPKSMLTMQGGSNQPNHYGAVPVVLGRMRFTPPVGANTFVETAGTTSHLRMMLIWGYGPLQISSPYIGATPLSRFEEVEVQTLDGDDTSEEVARFNKLYGQDVTQVGVDVKLESDGTTHTWVQRSIDEEVDRIEVVLSFPQGLYWMAAEGGNAGKRRDATVKGNIQIRQVGETSWTEAAETIRADRIQLAGAWFNIDSDAELEPVCQWTRLSLDKNSNIVVREGAYTLSPGSNPTGNLLKRLQGESFNADDTFDRLPAYGPEEEGLWDICMYGNAVHSTVDRRDGTVTGCGLTMSGRTAIVASGSIARIENESFRVTKKTANAFTQKYSFSVPRGLYEVRVRRTNTSETAFNTSAGNKANRYHDCILTSITGYAARRPLAFPKTLARTAIRIKATNQINGNVEGITATATSICKDWDRHTNTWVSRPTRNPASLFRYVLQHPANARPLPDSRIDLDALVSFHNYCRVEGFMFDMVVTDQRSLMDVLRDICAAGRASPTMVDGKWSVIIDRPRSSYSQFFTPHNSWGFEGVRVMPKMPHGFRVQFNNAEKQFQPDEMVVYNDGYSASNATLFEGLTLPGVTTTKAVFKHARFHLAQIKLRPETYTLHVDMEHLVCTRGDLVKVTHDVPMWGLGTGRIKDRISSSVLSLDEKVPMDAGVSYTIRIRLENGTNITRAVVPAAVEGYYNQITLTTSVTTAQGAAGNLFMFGALNEESVDCVVQSIEPMDNLTARLTLVDYSPAVYDSDTETIPAFDSQITKPPVLLLPTVTQRPTISGFKSDESVMSVTSGGDYLYAIRVSFNNPSGLPAKVTHTEGQIDWAGDTSDDWASELLVPVSGRSITFPEVEEGESYRIRLRYVDKDGRAGPWTTIKNHTVAGRVNAPSAPPSATATPDGSRLRIDWESSPEPDVKQYEVRLEDGNWGVNNSQRIYFGAATTCFRTLSALGGYTFYIRARDSIGKYSTTSRVVSYPYAAPPRVSAINHSFYDTTTTSATITLDWDDVEVPFGLKHYRVSHPGFSRTVSASAITLPATWLGNRTFSVETVDLNNNISPPRNLSITKLAPNPPQSVRLSVIDNNVMIYWSLPAPTTLPVSHVIIKRGDDFETAESIGRKDGAFTTINEVQAGTYTYWLQTVDTDGYESSAVSRTVRVSEPPDFVFHGKKTSTFNGILTSAIVENESVVLPVNTSETWEQHFTSRSWTTPQNQIDSGYPRYIQPTAGTGTYRETFDFGTVLASSKVTVNVQGTNISGSPAVSCKIDLSDDNATWAENEGVFEVFGSNFRYARVTITVTGGDITIYRLNSLTCEAAAKLKNDAGFTSCSALDALGTVANFTKDFIDVTSVTVTPSGTTPITAVYNYQDAVLSGTYSIASNVATVNVTGHELVVGQKVRLNFVTGTASPITATVTQVVTANQFRCEVTNANTSGNISIYPQGMRIYLFNSAGSRVSGSASWSIKGY